MNERQEVISMLRDVAHRIGSAATNEWVRGKIEEIANLLASWDRGRKPANKEMTYTLCGLCNGGLQISVEAKLLSCPCTRCPTPGWSPTGVTVKQLERLAKSHENIMALLIASEAAAPYRLMEMRAEYRQKHAPIIPTAEMVEAR